MRLLHTADWQYGCRNDPVWLDRQDAVVRWMFQVAQEQRVDAMLAVGDILEYKASPEIRDRLLKVMLESWKLDIPLIMIPGNHDEKDSAGSEHSLGFMDALASLSENAVLISGVEGIHVGDALFYGAPPDKVRDLAAKVAETRGTFPDLPAVGLLHATVTGSEFFNGQTGRGLAQEDLNIPGLDYFALGDIHKAQDLSPKIRYCGSPAQWTFGDDPEFCGVSFVDVKAGSAPEVTHLPAPVPLLRTIEFPVDSPLAESLITPSFVRLRPKGTMAELRLLDRGKVEQSLGPNAVWSAWDDLSPGTEVFPDMGGAKVLMEDPGQEIRDYVGRIEVLPDGVDKETLIQKALALWEKHVPAETGVGERLQFENLHLERIGPYQEVDLPLQDLGAVLVRGLNKDLGGSNGAGKSFPFFALEDALLGGTEWGIKKDGLVNTFLPGGGLSQVDFRGVDGNPYRITSKRKYKAGDKGTQETELSFAKRLSDGSFEDIAKGHDVAREAADKQLGMSEKLFRSIVLVGQGYKHGFLDAKSTERKRFISELFDLDKVDLCGKAVADDYKAVELERAGLLSTLDSNRDSVTMIKDGIKEAHEELETLPDHTEELERLKGEIAPLNEELAEVLADLKTLDKYEKAWVAYKEKKPERDTLEADIALLQEQLSGAPTEEKLREDLQSIAMSVGSCQGRLKQLGEDKSRLENSSVGADCPLCQTALDATQCTGLLQAMTGNEDELNQELVGLKAQRTTTNNILALYQRMRSFQGSLERLPYAPALPEAEITQQTGTRAQDKLRIAAQQSALQVRLNEMNQQMGQRQVVLKALEKSKADLERYNGLVQEQERQLDALVVKLAYLGALRQVYDPKGGVKAAKIERILLELTEVAETYLAFLSGGRMHIRVSPKMGKHETVEGISIWVSEGRKGELPWHNWSGGERQRCGIAVILAFWELVQEYSRRSANLLVLDEVFEGLDEAGIAGVQEIIPRIAKRVGTVFVVSHLPLMPTTFSHLLDIVKEDDLSTANLRPLAA